MLKNKQVVLGVTGSIAAYKIANLASALVKLHANVIVMMTKNATNFITPITFETLTGNKCYIDTFDRNFQFDVEHISIAKKADIVMLAPASANVIGKIANGIADDMLTTTIMACKCPVYISPAMNTNMFMNPIVQDNIEKLKKFDYKIIEPAEGMLACKDVGKGKMPEPEELLSCIIHEIAYEKDLKGKKILITAGPTQEKIDPVRYITNHSTGKMGYSIAEECLMRGAQVTLVTGPVSIKEPRGVNIISVISAADMANAVKEEYLKHDIIIKTAAVADYRPVNPAEEKMKKKSDELSIQLEKTEDILQFIGHHKKNGQFICGFSMETQNMLENSRTKLEKKKVDMIIANNLKVEGAGFGTDTNVVTMITQKDCIELEIMSKKETAHHIINNILKNIEKNILKNIEKNIDNN